MSKAEPFNPISPSSPKGRLFAAFSGAFAKVAEEAPKSNREYWIQLPDGTIGWQPRTQIIRLLLEQHEIRINSTEAEFILDTYINPKNRPPILKQGRGPKAGKGWTGGTLLSWLSNNGKAQPKNNTNYVVEALIRYAETKLIDRLPTGFSFESVFGTPNVTPLDIVKSIIDMLPTGTHSRLRLPSDIDENLLTEDPLFPGDEMRPDMRKVLAALRGEKSPHVLLAGPAYSGKSTLVRLLLQKIGPTLELDNEAKLPILALSLRHHSAWDAANRIASFYRNISGEDGTGHAAEAVADVRRLCRRMPAFIVLTDVDDLEQHEIARALRQDIAGEMLTLIAQGDTLTRILVTRTEDSVKPSRHIAEAFSAGIAFKRYSFDGQNGRTRTLARMAAALTVSLNLSSDVQRKWDRISQNVIKGQNTETSIDTKLETQIVAWLTESNDLPLAGLIATSADGIERDTLRRMLPAAKGETFRRLQDDSAARSIGRLEPVLRITGKKGEAKPNDVYFVNRAIRAPLLARWMEEDSSAREGAWLIAREAAAKARQIRIQATDGSARASLGRDLQALTSLIASIDPKEGAHDEEALSDHATEDTVLPPLDVDRSRPRASIACRYAFDVLYKVDLEGEESRPQPRLDDGRLRQAAIRPFFDPQPWRVGSAWKLSSSDAGPAPWTKLPVAARIELLQALAIAATRLMDTDQISAAVDCAKLLGSMAAVEVNPIHLMRIFRAEIDAAFLVGDNPDRIRNPDHRRDEKEGLGCIHDQINRVIEWMREECASSTKRDVAIGKLEIRDAELLHLMGQHREALSKFKAVERREQSLHYQSRDQPKARFRPHPILGGRGMRAYLRLCIDLALGTLFKEGAWAQGSERGWVRTGDWIQYDDGLVVPYPRRAQHPERRPLLRKARSLLASNVRRLSNGRSADLIGAKIDAARFALIEHKYAEAFVLLDEAKALAFAPGSSRDVLLELLAVRARVLTDAAGFAMATFGLDASRFDKAEQNELSALARQAGMELARQGSGKDFPNPGRSDARELSRWLCEQASDALNELNEMVMATPGKADCKPYAIYADYLGVWLQIIRSRGSRREASESARAAAIRSELTQASQTLGDVMRRMQTFDCRTNWREATLLKQGLHDYLARRAFADTDRAASRPK